MLQSRSCFRRFLVVTRRATMLPRRWGALLLLGIAAGCTITRLVQTVPKQWWEAKLYPGVIRITPNIFFVLDQVVYPGTGILP